VKWSKVISAHLKQRCSRQHNVEHHEYDEKAITGDALATRSGVIGWIEGDFTKTTGLSLILEAMIATT
jgi:hypothetical protein